MSLVYSVERSRAYGREFVDVADLFETKIQDAEYTLEVRTGEDALVFDLKELLGVEFSLHVESGDLQYVDHGSESYTRTPDWLENARSLLRDSRDGDDAQVRRQPRSTVELAGDEYQAEELVVERNDYRLVVTAVSWPPLPDRIVEGLWFVLLGWEADARSPALVTEISVVDDRQPATPMVHLELEDFSDQVESVTLDPPTGYQDVSADRTEAESEVTAQSPGLPRVNLRSSSRSERPFRKQGQDLGWIVQEDLLDELVDAVNTIGSCFSRFDQVSSSELRARSETMDFDGEDEAEEWRDEREHWLSVDWWSQVRDHLDVDDPDEAERAVQLLALYTAVSRGRSLPSSDADDDVRYHPQGLTADEQDAYDAIIDRVGDDPCNIAGEEFPPEVCRVMEFVTDDAAAFNRPFRREELAEAVADRFMRPAIVETGPAEITSEDMLSGGWEDVNLYELRFYDLSYSLRLENPDRLVRSVDVREPDSEHDTEYLQVRLFVPSVRCNFRYSVTPKLDAKSIACGIFSGGACWMHRINAGGGHGRLTNINLVVDVVPSMSGDELHLRGEFNLDDSLSPSHPHGTRFNFVTQGWNATANANEHTLAFLEAFGNFATRLIVSGIQDELDDLLDRPLVRWPNVFEAVRPPDLEATAVDLRPESNGGALEADVAGFPMTGVVTDVDQDRITETGYAFSKRFLQAWLEVAAPPWSETARRSARELAAAIGVELGDPSEIPDPEDADVPLGGHVEPPEAWRCRDPDAPPGPETDFYLSTTRRGPNVELPPTGSETDFAARLSFRYEISLEAIRQWYYYVPERIREPCLEGAPGKFGEPPFDEAFARFIASSQPRGLSQAGRQNREHAWRGAFTSAAGQAGFSGRIPRRPGDADFPLPGGSPDSTRICPTPYCEWHLREHEATIATYFDAEVIAEATLRVGFAPDGLMWLPQITVGIVPPDDDPNFDVRVARLDTAGPFEHVDRSTIEDQLVEQVRTETVTFISAFADDMPDPRTQLEVAVPDRIGGVLGGDGIPDDIVDWLTSVGNFSIGRPDLLYESDGELVYWPFELEQELTDAIRTGTE